MDAYQHMTGQEGFIGKIAKYIPGFGGYLEREKRRDADKLQREFLAGKIGALKGKMSDINQELSSSLKFDLIGPMDDNIKKADRIADRIRYADRGYAGFFDAVKINEKELGKIYEFDLSLLEYVNSVSEWVDVIETAIEDEEDDKDVKKKIKKLSKDLTAFDNKLNEREHVIMEVR